MNPLTLAALILLALTLGFAALGLVLVRLGKLGVRKAARYSRWATLLVLAAAYALAHADWPGVHLQPFDFWSCMVILAIACYTLVWAALAYLLNKSRHEEFGESFMLSMLHNDTDAAPPEAPPAAKPASRPDA
jgi:hypothetical protein